MKLIFGLGNPGAKYELTRHNIGFIIIDLFAQKHQADFKPGKGDWYEAAIKINDEDVRLIKPTTYMNNSGVAVKEITDKLNDEANSRIKDVLIVYDDIYLKLGTIRLRGSGSDGGHNGIKSINYHLNTDEYPRMRVGIGTEKEVPKEDMIDFVLGKFSSDEIETIKKMMPVYFDCLKSFTETSLLNTMNSFNRSFIENDKTESSDTPGTSI
ncbi:aminoacyl-tRNA hydrolase [soil metagenome]